MERSARRGLVLALPRISLRFIRATPQTSIAAVTRTWSDGPPPPRAALAVSMRQTRRAVPGLRRDPDVSETAPAVGGLPVVHRAIAPPRVELLGLGGQFAHRVDPVAGFAEAVELLGLDRRMRDDFQHLLVAPDIMLERGHVEVADQDGALAGGRTELLHAVQFVKEGELVGEFLVDRRIRLVAAGRDVEIMHGDRVAQARLLAERHRDVAAVLLAAIIVDRDALERQAREHRDAVIAPLPIQQS